MPKALQLPTAESCFDKMNLFRVEALEQRNQMFDDLTQKLKVVDACKAMKALMGEQTDTARDRTTFKGDSWTGVPAVPISVANIEEKIAKDMQGSQDDVANAIKVLKEAGVQAVHMDFAADENSKVLVGYDVPTGEAKVAAGALFNACAYIEQQIVSQDSQFLQGTTKDKVQLDKDGKEIPATKAQIESALDAMKEKLNAVGIAFDVTQFDYKDVTATVSAEKTKVEVAEERKPAAAEEKKPEVAPEDRTRPT